MSKVQELKHVSLATTYEIDSTFDSEKFIKMRLRVCHDGINPNKSSFEVADMESAKDSIKNIPILANVIFDSEGNPQFGGHDMELEDSKTKEGEYKLIYKETPIGVVPESCNHEIKEFNGKNYVFVDAYVWKNYSNYAQDIIERDNDIKLSMEILVDEYSYNAKQKVYNITAYRYSGITFLNKDYGTGMENALATTGTFSEDENKEKFIIMMEELKETLQSYDINNQERGSNVEEKLKLLQDNNLTVESLDFSIDELSLEDLEVKIKEFIEKQNIDTSVEEKEPEKYVKSFELSHSDIRYALYQLLSPVETEDNEWYFIDQVYDDRFEYMNWEGTKIYRQYYIKDGDNVEFSGERIELFQVRLTKEEKDALDSLKDGYSALEAEVNELRSYKQDIETEARNEAEKALFETFPQLVGNEEFENLKKKSSEFTLEQLEKEISHIVVKTSEEFKAYSQKREQNPIVKIKNFKHESNDNNPYGDLFDKVKKD